MSIPFTCQVRAAGDVIGYAHPGNCTETVLRHLEKDYPEEDHTVESGAWEIALKDADCVACGATL